MIPIVLFLIDVGVLVLANVINGDLAKSTARAAASAADGPAATTSAQNAVNHFSTSGSIISNASLTYLQWRGDPNVADTTSGSLPANFPSPQPGQVIAVTTVTVKLPVPFPMLPASQQFSAYSIQPIVAVKPNLPGSQGP